MFCIHSGNHQRNVVLSQSPRSPRENQTNVNYFLMWTNVMKHGHLFRQLFKHPIQQKINSPLVLKLLTLFMKKINLLVQIVKALESPVPSKQETAWYKGHIHKRPNKCQPPRCSWGDCRCVQGIRVEHLETSMSCFPSKKNKILNIFEAVSILKTVMRPLICFVSPALPSCSALAFEAANGYRFFLFCFVF